MEMNDIYINKVSKVLTDMKEDIKSSGEDPQEFILTALAHMAVRIKEQDETISKLSEIVGSM